MAKPNIDTSFTKSEKENVIPQKQWQMVWRQFKRHQIAVIGLIILIVFYIIGVIFPEFFAPYGKFTRTDYIYLPPQKIHFIDNSEHLYFRPFVYGFEKKFDPQTWKTIYEENINKIYPIFFFVKGEEYKLLGLFKTNIHLFGIRNEEKIFLLGSDDLGRDMLSRIIFAMRISLTIGFVGIVISFFLGLLFGSISGLFGGVVDDIIQRIIETLMSIPKIPLWMALAAAIPRNWSALQIYFAITVILSLMSWTGLARVVRSKFISLREEDFVSAARSYNASTSLIIRRHLIPNFITYIIVNLTLTIPAMIIAETSLSFLGIGLRPPVVSLGVLLQTAQKFRMVSLYPWFLIPGVVVIFVVLAYNFVGDGIRDAADPYD